VVKTMDEQVQLDEVVERLSARFPSLSPVTVADVVRELHATFLGAPLREFVPLFVERKARSALAELSMSDEDIPTAVG
jgi:hypothetical protein